MSEFSVARLFDLTPAGIAPIGTARAPVRGRAESPEEVEAVAEAQA